MKLSASDLVVNRVTDHAMMCMNNRTYALVDTKSISKVFIVRVPESPSLVPSSPIQIGESFISVFKSGKLMKVNPKDLFMLPVEVNIDEIDFK